MSTEFTILEHESGEQVEISESSTLFSVGIITPTADPNEPRIEYSRQRYTPEQMIDAALKMMQAALYNCDDPIAIVRDKINPGVSNLFV